MLVTHDQEEALEIADRIVVMHEGRVEQAGAPDEVYVCPASPFVVRFFGEANRLAARRSGDRLALVSAGASVNGANGHEAPLVGLVRPHDVTLSRTPAEGALPVLVGRARRTGPLIRLALHDEDASDTSVAPIDAELSHERFVELGLQPGERAFALPRNVHVFE